MQTIHPVKTEDTSVTIEHVRDDTCDAGGPTREEIARLAIQLW